MIGMFSGTQKAITSKKMGEYNRKIDLDLNARLTICDSNKKIDESYDKLIELHKNRWNNLSNAFNSRKYIEFHKNIAKLFFNNNWLRLYLLQDGEKAIGGIYCYFYN